MLSAAAVSQRSAITAALSESIHAEHAACEGARKIKSCAASTLMQRQLFAAVVEPRRFCCRPSTVTAVSCTVPFQVRLRRPAPRTQAGASLLGVGSRQRRQQLLSSSTWKVRAVRPDGFSLTRRPALGSTTGRALASGGATKTDRADGSGGAALVARDSGAAVCAGGRGAAAPAFLL